MNDLVKLQLEETTENMDKAVAHAGNELSKIRAGKATPSMLDSVAVDYYGAMTPLSQIATVNTPDARTLVVQPWEKSMISPIEKAIIDSNLGLNPQNDGIMIRLAIPLLTEERRKDLVKKVKDEGEKGKIVIRNLRKDSNDKVKKLKADGLSEDDIKVAEADIQKLTDSFIVKIDKLVEVKELDIMTV